MTAEAYVPLYYAPGEACQFDWSHEIVLIQGGNDDGEGRPCPTLPQPDDVRAGLYRPYLIVGAARCGRARNQGAGQRSIANSASCFDLAST